MVERLSGRGTDLRFEWAAGGRCERIGWTHYSLLAPLRRPWLGPLAGFVGSVVGGLLWRFSSDAPRNLRIALTVDARRSRAGNSG